MDVEPKSEWPKREFFESDPKAQEIRETCIPILGRIRRLLYGADNIENREERLKLYSELEKDNGTLIELGIKEEMMTGKTMEEYKEDALITAQYLAGQLLPMTGDEAISIVEGVTAAGEFSESLDEGIRIVELDKAPKQAKGFMKQQQIFNFIKEGFAIENSEFKRFDND